MSEDRLFEPNQNEGENKSRSRFFIISRVDIFNLIFPNLFKCDSEDPYTVKKNALKI